MLEKEDIEKIIPQRDPFLMIDEVEEFIPGEMGHPIPITTPM